MRFGLAHKITTYLTVGAAFVAMTGGGGVSPPITALGFIGLVFSWWWEPPNVRFEKWSLVWTIASLFVLAYAVLSAIATADYLAVGAEFLIWLSVAKACNRRAARDWQQLYLLAFLMLVAGSVLNPDLSYGVAFLVYVVAATWALTLFHLRREMEDNFLLKHADDRASERVEVRRILASRRIVGGRFFVGTGFVSLAVFAASAAFFLTIPRVGMGFFFKSRGGFTMAGFNDAGVKLGGHGRIKMDSTIVMRVELPSKYGSRSAPAIHWRGVTFDHYAAGQWRRTDQAPVTDARNDYQSGKIRIVMGDDPRDPSDIQQTTVRQDIWLEPLDSTVLFGASKPAVFVVDRNLMRRSGGHPLPRGEEIRMTQAQSSTTHYQVWSALEPPPPEWLRAAPHLEPHDLPDDNWIYLQLPPEITQRTRDLARTITAGLTNDYDRAIALQTWLQTNLTYTLDLADPPGLQEHVDFFLFDRKKGHCEFFASAFAVLARSLDMPTRNVNGFLGGEWNEYDDYVAVRAGDAHSWVEVYFPGHGWVTFDPTPGGQDRLGRGGDGILARLRRFLDTVRFQWAKWVIEYDLYRQLALFRAIGRFIKRGAIAIKDGVVFAVRWLIDHWYVSVPIGIGLLLLFIRWLRRRPRGRDDDGARARASRRRRPIAVVYTQVVDKLAKRGLVRDPAMTPRELARGWRSQPGGDSLVELTELYYAVEYGTADEAGALPRARSLRDTILATKPTRG